jgi:hypothetical protein
MMTSQTWVNASRRIYSRLLSLYPKEHREEYGPLMRQVFTDQCRSAFQSGGLKGIILLWLRTLKDLFASALREHISSPRSGWGLLEAVPNKPLPWMGVVLVLIPCLVFFIGQIGQLAGQDWFFLLIRRAAYFLIVPVLLTWIFTRRFPVWGLIPLGVFINTATDVLYSIEFHLEKLNGTVFWRLGFFLKMHMTEVKVFIVAAMLMIGILLVVSILRQQKFSRSARIWTAVFVILLSLELLQGVRWYANNMEYYWNGTLFQPSILSFLRYILQSSYYSFTYNIEFPLLILAGALLARRHGRLAVLLPLGYLIPAILLGRYDYSPDQPFFLLWAGATVFVYRAIVTLVAPVWIVRSASDGGQRRAGAVGLFAAVGITIAAHIGLLLVYYFNYSMGNVSWLDVYYTISPDLIMAAGIALAISLYQRGPSESNAENPEIAAANLADV